MGFNKLSEKCQKCSYANICKSKRMESCAYMENALRKTLSHAISELISQNPTVGFSVPFSYEQFLKDFSKFSRKVGIKDKLNMQFQKMM